MTQGDQFEALLYRARHGTFFERMAARREVKAKFKALPSTSIGYTAPERPVTPFTDATVRSVTNGMHAAVTGATLRAIVWMLAIGMPGTWAAYSADVPLLLAHDVGSPLLARRSVLLLIVWGGAAIVGWFSWWRRLDSHARAIAGYARWH